MSVSGEGDVEQAPWPVQLAAPKACSPQRPPAPHALNVLRGSEGPRAPETGLPALRQTEEV